MKGPLDRTKVVVRHLPPTISHSNLFDHVDSRFSGRYNWLAFRPGKSSQKNLIYSRAYINFNEPEDVIEFSEFFNGHVFVNEKGAQFKSIVEYAPSQRIPMHCSKTDGREGTILKDSEYLEFLEFLSKPVESLPSAEIQLERKEAERAGAPKDVPIVTPLMDYVRKKRAAKGGTRRTVINGKLTRRVRGNSSKSSASGSSKKGSEKQSATTMYALRERSKGGRKDKSTYLLVSKHYEKLSEQSANLTASEVDPLERGSGSSGSIGAGKKILLLKGKEMEIPVSVGASLKQSESSPSKTSHSSIPFRHNQRQEAGGRIIRSILLNKDTHQNQVPPESHSESRIQASTQERDKRPPRRLSTHSSPKEVNGAPEGKAVNNGVQAVHTEKQERWMKNKDRPDRGLWAPLQRSDGSHSSNDSLSSPASQTCQPMDSTEDMKNERWGAEYQHTGGGRGIRYSIENGSYRHGSRRSSSYYTKDAEVLEGKPSKRGVSSGYGTHEKQVWVQKSSSGS